MPHTGLQPRGCCGLKEAVFGVLARLYGGRETKIDFEIRRKLRDGAIREEYAQGYTIPELARIYQLSNARIHQIIHIAT